MTEPTSRWAIVLAGGEGKRLRPLIEDLFGAPIPKQYCTFCGTRSMLQHTVDRAAKIVDPNRILTVVGNGHRRFLTEEMPGRLIEQPAPRETAPGVFLPASYAMSQD
ncbi:MAG TPA: sugar phosphate nucleotidyltransferase, partial [Acidobacteriota bacterium]|nr:sugar phosphate nucleotidyltransferase [Acidobacteriota bacterium]